MWIIEIPDDGVGSPADGDKVEEPCDGKEDARDASNTGLEAVYTDALSALGSEDPQRQGQAAHQDGEHGEASGSLHVTGQSQQAVIHLTLDLTRALHNAIHPQAFPNDLSRHYVVTNEGSDPPHGDGTDYRPTHPPHKGHDQAHQLHARVGHGSCCRSVARVAPLRCPEVWMTDGPEDSVQSPGRLEESEARSQRSGELKWSGSISLDTRDWTGDGAALRDASAKTRRDDEGSIVFAAMQATRTEEWMKSVSECICEGVNVDSRFRAVEGHAALSVVQKYAHLPGSLFQSQRNPGIWVSVLLPQLLDLLFDLLHQCCHSFLLLSLSPLNCVNYGFVTLLHSVDEGRKDLLALSHLSEYWQRQDEQKLCPHGVVTGLLPGPFLLLIHQLRHL
ncbi:hypothetical protein EYF80_018188 [Liparis tanakae]|uniref:Uncharacterized protein n=1 Tax=Liparis tanakae TaxID=230148 RepID=A0A4Z2I2N0_9TELE|nr:hypothetical protein EYF80_018188 [Liparis tanakae]